MTDAGDAAPAAGPGSPAGPAVERLVEVVDLLRRHCAWTAALDHASLLAYLVEETYELYEVLDAVASEDRPSPGLLDDLRSELGDVLYQVVLHAQLRAEKGGLSLGDVAEGLTAKLVRRNSHVFAPDGTLRDAFPVSSSEIVATWQQVKHGEHPERTSVFDGIPPHLPALALAAKTITRAGEPGRSHGVEQPDDDAFGRELLEVTRRAVAAGVDPERALRRAVLTYQHDVQRESQAESQPDHGERRRDGDGRPRQAAGAGTASRDCAPVAGAGGVDSP